MMKGMAVLRKTIISLAICAVMIVSVARTVPAKADSGATVRVSTQAELEKAMGRSDVGTIIFRTQAETKVNIKADPASKGKTLIIDAENVSFVNKARFDKIDIRYSRAYTENVSGNSIELNGLIFDDFGLIIAKGRKLAKLTVYDNFWALDAKWTVRKNASISKVDLIYSWEKESVSAKYDKNKRQFKLSLTNAFGFKQDVSAKLDKSGRLIEAVSDSDAEEFKYGCRFYYDKNGNIKKKTGDESIDDYTVRYKYKNGRLKQKIYKGFSENKTVYTYNKKGLLVKEKQFCIDSMDGITFVIEYVYKYGYDKQGRNTSFSRKETTSYPGGEYETVTREDEVVKTFDKAGFMIRQVKTSKETDATYRYTTVMEYNKAGDLIKSVTKEWNSKTNTETVTNEDEYSYNELGELIG